MEGYNFTTDELLLKRLEPEVEGIKQKIIENIEETKQYIHNSFETLRYDLLAAMEKHKNTLIYWIMGMTFTLIGVMIALQKF